MSLTSRRYLSPTATLPLLEFLAAGRRKRDLGRTKYEGVEERQQHKLWQSLQEMATTRSGLYTIALRVEEEGTSLVHVGGLTSRVSGDDEVANSYN